MNPESFHFLMDEMSKPNAWMFIVGLPLFALFFYWVYRRRVHPVGVWAILSLAFYSMSQIFPENRTDDQRFQLAVLAPIFCAVGTWVLFRFTSLRNRDSL
jgi:hypothetical protein